MNLVSDWLAQLNATKIRYRPLVSSTPTTEDNLGTQAVEPELNSCTAPAPQNNFGSATLHLVQKSIKKRPLFSFLSLGYPYMNVGEHGEAPGADEGKEEAHKDPNPEACSTNMFKKRTEARFSVCWTLIPTQRPAARSQHF